MNKKYLPVILFSGLVFVILLAACIPFEGSIEEVRAKAGEGKAVTYTVNYNANGGKEDPPNPETVPAGYLITLLPENTFTQDDHTFTGWNTRADGTGTSCAAGDEYQVNENVTFYAQWILNMSGTVAIILAPGHGAWIRAILMADTSNLNITGPFEYQWKRGGSDIPGATELIYVVSDQNQEQSLTVEVRQTGTGKTVSSGEFVVPNRIGIYNQMQLENIGMERNYILADDISIVGHWSPIYASGIYFKGTFDGNGKTIDLGYQSYTGGSVGLFTSIGSGGEVKNLRLTGSINIDNNDEFSAGALAAQNQGGYIHNISSKVDITLNENSTSNNLQIGGIVGVLGSGTIQNCYSTGWMQSKTPNASSVFVGGIAGSQLEGTIKNCWASGLIWTEGTIYAMAGGIVGSQIKSPLFSGGSTIYCVALNISIYSNRSTDAGRITGNADGALERNYASDNMQVSNEMVDSDDDSSKDGADASIPAIATTPGGGWWTDTAGWTNTGVGAVWGGTGEDIPWKWEFILGRPILWFENGVNQQ